MTTPATVTPSTPQDAPAVNPSNPTNERPKRAVAIPGGGGAAGAATDARDAAAREAKAKLEADAASAAKAKADEAARKAAVEAAAAKAKQESLEALDRARKHLRRATPDDPIPLRRLETNNPVGDSQFFGKRVEIDLRNSEYVKVSLLFDGQVVHVVHRDDPKRSFWVGYGNIAAMYPLFDI